MKAISIKQPWASLACLGIKDIENRTWKCPQKYIGKRVMIHASASKKDASFNVLTSKQLQYLIDNWDNNLSLMKNGAIIGSAEIVDCVINHPSIWAEESNDNKCPECGRTITDLKSDYQECPDCRRKLWRHSEYDIPIYNWVLANPTLYDTPIPIKGKLSFWESGYNEVKIKCPQCGSVETAIENFTTPPFGTYIHDCLNCGYTIEESEWLPISENSGKLK